MDFWFKTWKKIYFYIIVLLRKNLQIKNNMKKKTISLWAFFAMSISIIFWYTLVFASSSPKIDFKSSNNIFLDSLTLNKVQVVINSKNNLNDLKITWDCWVFWKLLVKNNYLYWYELRFLDKECDLSKVKVNFDTWTEVFSTYFDINTNFNLYSKFLDYSDPLLQKSLDNLNYWIKALSSYKSYNSLIHKSIYEYKSQNRRLEELNYMKDFLQKIADDRQKKYRVPVKNSTISTISSKLPNAWRPYREDYTDWIHEWWDFDTDFWATVYAIDNWIVVRVVDKFYFSDFNKIVRWDNLSVLQKRKNLDILRGKQVWIKTMKWDVAFYSHLDSVFWNIKVWDTVMKWQPLWSVWISWVPDKNYNDYHLHIEVRKNPYENSSAWKYDLDDYMGWDWYFKWKSEKYILENQDNIFE